MGHCDERLLPDDVAWKNRSTFKSKKCDNRSGNGRSSDYCHQDLVLHDLCSTLIDFGFWQDEGLSGPGVSPTSLPTESKTTVTKNHPNFVTLMKALFAILETREKTDPTDAGMLALHLLCVPTLMSAYLLECSWYCILSALLRTLIELSQQWQCEDLVHDVRSNEKTKVLRLECEMTYVSMRSSWWYACSTRDSTRALPLA